MSNFFYKHKLVSMFFVLWSMLLVSWVVYQVFFDVTKINAAINSALGIVFGLPTAAIGLWQWRNGKDAKPDS